MRLSYLLSKRQMNESKEIIRDTTGKRNQKLLCILVYVHVPWMDQIERCYWKDTFYTFYAHLEELCKRKVH